MPVLSPGSSRPNLACSCERFNGDFCISAWDSQVLSHLPKSNVNRASLYCHCSYEDSRAMQPSIFTIERKTSRIVFILVTGFRAKDYKMVENNRRPCVFSMKTKIPKMKYLINRAKAYSRISFRNSDDLFEISIKICESTKIALTWAVSQLIARKKVNGAIETSLNHLALSMNWINTSSAHTHTLHTNIPGPNIAEKKDTKSSWFHHNSI